MYKKNTISKTWITLYDSVFLTTAWSSAVWLHRSITVRCLSLSVCLSLVSLDISHSSAVQLTPVLFLLYYFSKSLAILSRFLCPFCSLYTPVLILGTLLLWLHHVPLPDVWFLLHLSIFPPPALSPFLSLSLSVSLGKAAFLLGFSRPPCEFRRRNDQRLWSLPLGKFLRPVPWERSLVRPISVPSSFSPWQPKIIPSDGRYGNWDAATTSRGWGKIGGGAGQ